MKLPFLVLPLLALPVSAFTFSESIDGDLSSSPTAPTALGATTLGSNVVTGATGQGDGDYLTLTVPAGQQLTAVTLLSTSGSGHFFGFTLGTTASSTASGLELGYLFGTEFVNEDLLTSSNIASAPVFAGSALPSPLALGPGDYTFHFQENAGGLNTTPFSVDFVTSVPEPSSALLGLLGLAMTVTRRQRR